ncbi:response regulator [Sphingobacterium sp. SRCM116780]|uniref:response regulator n=1 Tax=Sphingobacterium sp. SRCM116780 TaxID=2907623 RepID=UPI001F1A7D66|nr:response regulator [Sphingobacterium sp. SRCM116780]UIR54627.1 response regulator [Sphingobacterium sp. SRCM116780]
MNADKTILIFEDDATILEIVTIILEDAGYQVSISKTSHDVIEKVAAIKPDLILMDNWIPNIGGIQATRLLKKNPEYKHIPVIYITANSDIAALAESAGADDFLAKPFNLDDLEAIVAKYVNR